MRLGMIGELATRERSRPQAFDLREKNSHAAGEHASRHRVPPTLALQGVSKCWRRQSRPVLDGIDFDLDPGELVWIGGQNGVGKTTLLRIVAGVITPDDGSIRLQGLDPERNRRSYQSRMGFLSAGNTGLIARLSTRYHLQYWARLTLLPRPERDEAIERALTAFSLHELGPMRVDRLSMGQRQRLRAALAFLHTPEVVLLDEPFTSLDDGGAAMLSAAVDEVTARGGAVIACSPPGDGQPRLDFDRRYVIEAGKLVAA